jgi:predicted GNAT superfamily acetyltransferase
MEIRELTPADLPAALVLNNANVPAVSPSDEAGFARLLELTDVALAAVDNDPADGPQPAALLGFVLLMRPGADYPSENYRWFDARGSDFLYVDRIVVADEAQNQGVGAALYAAVFAAGRKWGATEVTCEVNVEPPNPGSLRFHARLGFVEVGRQATKADTIVVSLLAAPVDDGDVKKR